MSSLFSLLSLCPVRAARWWPDSSGVWNWGLLRNGSGVGGWNSPFGVEALGLTREKGFTVTAACRGHCREAVSSVAVTPPVSFQPMLRPKFRVSKSKLDVCVKNWEAGRITWSPFSLSAAQLKNPWRGMWSVLASNTKRRKEWRDG